MPYFIQFVKDLSSKVETVQKSTDDIKKKEEKQAQEKLDQPLDMNVEMLFPGADPQIAALMPPPGMMQKIRMSMGMNPMGSGMGMNP